jgi:hypothetical protein
MAGSLRAVPRKIGNILGSKTVVVMLIVVVVVSAAGNFILQRPVTKPDEMQRAYSSSVPGLLPAASPGRMLPFPPTSTGRIPPHDAEGWFPASLAASPFLLSALVSGILVWLLYLLLFWRRDDLERMLQSAEELDRITYRTIAIAFPLVTLMIAGERTGRTVPGARTGAAIPKKRGPPSPGWCMPAICKRALLADGEDVAPPISRFSGLEW